MIWGTTIYGNIHLKTNCFGTPTTWRFFIVKYQGSRPAIPLEPPLPAGFTVGFTVGWIITLQGINISHLGKRKIIFKMPFLGDMLVSWRVMLSTQFQQQTHQTWNHQNVCSQTLLGHKHQKITNPPQKRKTHTHTHIHIYIYIYHKYICIYIEIST